MSAPKDPEKKKLWKENISKGQKGKKKGQRIHKICLYCSRSFIVVPSLEHLKCCSNECRYKAQSETMLGKNNLAFGNSSPTLVDWQKQHLGNKSPNYGKKRPDLAERNRQQVRKKHPFYGKKRPAHAEKMKMKGLMLGEKNYWFGKKNPKIAKWNKEHSGKKSPSYKNGKSYEPYSIEFARIRRNGDIRKRDGYVCQKCELPEIGEIDNRRLAIHHIDGDKDNNNHDNLITLCIKCNNKVKKNHKKWIHYFQKKLGEEIGDSQLCLIRLN